MTTNFCLRQKYPLGTEATIPNHLWVVFIAFMSTMLPKLLNNRKSGNEVWAHQLNAPRYRIGIGKTVSRMYLANVSANWSGSDLQFATSKTELIRPEHKRCTGLEANHCTAPGYHRLWAVWLKKNWWNMRFFNRIQTNWINRNGIILSLKAGKVKTN